jgi:hypothetical protein
LSGVSAALWNAVVYLPEKVADCLTDNGVEATAGSR